MRIVKCDAAAEDDTSCAQQVVSCDQEGYVRVFACLGGLYSGYSRQFGEGLGDGGFLFQRVLYRRENQVCTMGVACWLIIFYWHSPRTVSFINKGGVCLRLSF